MESGYRKSQAKDPYRSARRPRRRPKAQTPACSRPTEPKERQPQHGTALPPFPSSRDPPLLLTVPASTCAVPPNSALRCGGSTKAEPPAAARWGAAGPPSHAAPLPSRAPSPVAHCTGAPAPLPSAFRTRPKPLRSLRQLQLASRFSSKPPHSTDPQGCGCYWDNEALLSPGQFASPGER